MPSTADFSGRWRVVEMPDFTDDYLDLSPDPRIELRVKRGGRADGEFEFGAQGGSITGTVERRDGGLPRLLFSFEGLDEGDPVNGMGLADVDRSGDLVGEFRYHSGDAYRFRCKRDRRRGAKARRA